MQSERVVGGEYVNDIKICPIKFNNNDKQQIKGYKLIPDCYGNAYINSKKFSGKTTMATRILIEKCDKDTIVIIFSATLYSDPHFQYIQKYCEAHDIQFEGYSCMIENRVNHLEDIINHIKECDKKELELKQQLEDAKGLSVEDKAMNKFINDNCVVQKNEKIKKKERPKRYLTPKYFIFCDDISAELRNNPVVNSLIKQSRHYKIFLLISSQYQCDIKPEMWINLDYVFLFKNLPEKTLHQIYEKNSLSISETTFLKLYNHATSTPYSFLFINKPQEIYKKNFNFQYNIKKI